ncbi:MAG TPA: hypothetical protein VGH10_02340 [Actinomycetota bacterium]|jgi:hypothetical protein
MVTKQTTPTRKTTAQKAPEGQPLTALYASLGAGELIVEKAKELSGKAIHVAQMPREDRMKSAVKVYEELAARGERLASKIRSSGYTQTAVDGAQAAVGQAKSAGQQVTAATSKGVRKAVDSATSATKAASKAASKATSRTAE